MRSLIENMKNLDTKKNKIKIIHILIYAKLLSLWRKYFVFGSLCILKYLV